MDIIRINASFGTLDDMNKLFDRHSYAPIMFDLPMDRKKYRTNEYTTNELQKYAEQRNAGYFAISYVKSVSDLSRFGALWIVPKIECIEGIVNFNAIVVNSDAIMIDRTDLRECIGSRTHFVTLQKEIVRQCHKFNVPVMLASDILDISTNIIDPEIKTLGLNDNDYIVLSEETAMGVNAQKNVDRIRKYYE
ncbi:MAG TPA: hypothetical protein ENH82_06985 [bacterium]|nr:hypothetical protein [bacterium]